jgi:hypothetical protein
MQRNDLKATKSFPQVLLLAGIAGPILFASIILVLGVISVGYSPVSQVISELELYNYGSVQVANFIISGSLLIAFSVGFYMAMQGIIIKKSRRVGASILLSLAGVGLILGGIFITDPSGPNVVHTIRGVLHVVAGFMVFALPPPIAFIIVGLALPKVRSLRIYRAYSVIAGVATYGLIALFLFASGNTQLGGIHTIGIFNRIATIEALAWYVVTAVTVLSLTCKEKSMLVERKTTL